MDGWTHRRKNKSRDPYLKLHQATAPEFEGLPKEAVSGTIFIDQDEKFRFLKWEEVVKL